MAPPTNQTCHRCGAELLPESHGGLCSACLLESALSESVAPSEMDTHTEVLPNDEPGRAPRPGGAPLREFGQYELLDEIARGGQGVVFKAWQRNLNRLVALKMIGLGPWAREPHLKRFKTEAEAAANLDHPQIVPIYEIGQIEGQHYFTMKLVEGISLKEAVRGGPLAPRRAAAITATIARAIHYAHERGILHRDLKPGNVLLDSEDRAYVTDFGLAKLIENESTVTHTLDLLGTPSYMPPEQASGGAKDLTRAGDVYGLGAVLYELLTANPPFAGGTTVETIRLVLENEPRRPKFWNSKIDRDLEVICLKCLEKTPEARYPTAEALAQDLERWLRHEPIQARPSSLVNRGAKWIRRKPATAGALGALAALAAAIGVIVWQGISAPTAGARDRKTLAVVIRAADPASSLLAKECSRDLINLCTRLSGLKTVPRTEILKWETGEHPAEQLGSALAASAVLTGELQQVGEGFHLRMDLASISGGQTRHLWTQTLTNLASDWDATRSRIAREVVTRLAIATSGDDQNLLQRPASKSQAARIEYFRGCHDLDSVSEVEGEKAVRHFEAAIRLDPQFAQAHAMLGYALLNLAYNFQDPAQLFQRARASVQAALSLDPQLPEAKIADGLLKYFFEWDWEGSKRAFAEAWRLDLSALDSNACYLHMLDAFGEGAEALNQVQRAVSLHPTSTSIQEELGCAAYYAGLLDQAEVYSRESVANDPENFMVYWSLARTLAQKSLYEEALTTLNIGRTKPGSSAFPAIDAERAYVLAKQGRRDEAEQLVAALHDREAKDYIDPYLFAMISAGLGDAEKVFQHLTVACDKRSSWMVSFPVEPKFFPFRHDPRYQKLLTRMNLPVSRFSADLSK